MARVVLGCDKYKLRPQKPLYIACEDLDFTWYHSEVRQVINDYINGVSVLKMAKKLNREQEEVAILIMDLARQGRIKPRMGGIFSGPA